MAHLIESVNGKAEIAYAGETPWHGLGQNLSPDAPISVWQQEAGLNWTANMHPAMYRDDFGYEKTTDSHYVLYRSDTQKSLGVVGNRYHVHNPSEILQFFNELAETAGFKLEVAGTIKGGQRIWALANTNKEACVMGDDAVKAYLLLSTSFDGSRATVGQFTNIRVVCNNTLSASDNEQGVSRISLRHGSAFDACFMRDQLGIAVNGFQTTIEKYRELAKTSVDAKFVDRFLSKLFPTTIIPDTGIVAHSKGYERVMTLFENGAIGSDLKGIQGTRWGLLNCVTQYIDHEKGHNTDTRLNSAWFGLGNKIKTNAENLLIGNLPVTNTL